MIAGNAYCLSNLPIFSVPNSVGIEEFAAILFLRICYDFNLEDKRCISRDGLTAAVCAVTE